MSNTTQARKHVSIADAVEARMVALKAEHANGAHTHKVFGCPRCS